MKKLISTLLIILLLINCTSAVLAEERIIAVFVDGTEIQFDVHPISENGRTLVPMRYIFEALGAEVNWIQEENRVIAAKGDITIDITLGSDVMYRNDAAITLEVPAKAIDGRTMVPARAVSEALDAKVEWNAEDYRVIITSTANPYTPGEYHYTELSERDMATLRKLYPDLYVTYAAEVLYDNMAEYPADVAELINAEDARIRMFADDVWNNMMAHTIINIQTESEDMYIFDIPEETDIDSYSLMHDYIGLTEKENMSSEAVLVSGFETTPGGKKVLYLYYHDREFLTTNDENSNLAKNNIQRIAVVPTEENFRYFFTSVNPIRSSLVVDVYEVTPGGIIEAGLCADYSNEKFLESIDEIIDKSEISDTAEKAE